MQRMVHQLAVEKGWYTPVKSDGECIAMMHSELSEALEEVRKGYQHGLEIYQDTSGPGSTGIQTPRSKAWDPKLKPEGVLIELADCVIRIMDTCEHKGWDLNKAILLKHAYNKTRSYRHGGKLL